MKKIKIALLLMLVVLLTACGSDGGNSGTNVDTVITETPVEDGTLRGAIAVNLIKTEDETEVLSAAVLQEPEMIRLVVRQIDEGYKVITDIAVPVTETVKISVPENTGYVMDAISYLDSPRRLVLKHAQLDDISVVVGETTNVSLILEPISIDTSIPESVTAGEEYTVSGTPSFPFNTVVQVTPQKIPFSDEPQFPVGWVSFFGEAITLNAPATESESTLYFQFKFYLDENFITDDESTINWSFFSPNITQGDDQISCPLLLPDGEIGVTIKY